MTQHRSSSPADPVVVVAMARTPIGGLLGALAPLSAVALGAHAVRAALARLPELSATAPDSLILGCVLPAGLGQAPARQAALSAGMPNTIDATTINKMCGSGLKAVMLGFDALRAGSASAVVAGGMESMSNAPYLMPGARAGLRYGNSQLLDHLAFDGLEDAYERGRPMGHFAERCAAALKISRAEQDDFARASFERARTAQHDGAFNEEIAPIEVPARNGSRLCAQDEGPGKADLDKIPHLRPVFDPQGTITAANASSISDGAAALVLMPASRAAALGLAPLATLHGHATHSQAPAEFSTAPIGAVQKLLRQLNWPTGDVDLYEINEAFAVVTLAAMRALALPHARVNVHGGACALGHPIGASGARILVTLIAALRRRGGGRGVASLCIGGGEAVALGVSVGLDPGDAITSSHATHASPPPC